MRRTFINLEGLQESTLPYEYLMVKGKEIRKIEYGIEDEVYFTSTYDIIGISKKGIIYSLDSRGRKIYAEDFFGNTKEIIVFDRYTTDFNIVGDYILYSKPPSSDKFLNNREDLIKTFSKSEYNNFHRMVLAEKSILMSENRALKQYNYSNYSLLNTTNLEKTPTLTYNSDKNFIRFVFTNNSSPSRWENIILNKSSNLFLHTGNHNQWFCTDSNFIYVLKGDSMLEKRNISSPTIITNSVNTDLPFGAYDSPNIICYKNILYATNGLNTKTFNANTLSMINNYSNTYIRNKFIKLL